MLGCRSALGHRTGDLRVPPHHQGPGRRRSGLEPQIDRLAGELSQVRLESRPPAADRIHAVGELAVDQHPAVFASLGDDLDSQAAANGQPGRRLKPQPRPPRHLKLPAQGASRLLASQAGWLRPSSSTDRTSPLARDCGAEYRRPSAAISARPSTGWVSRRRPMRDDRSAPVGVAAEVEGHLARVERIGRFERVRCGAKSSPAPFQYSSTCPVNGSRK